MSIKNTPISHEDIQEDLRNIGWTLIKNYATTNDCIQIKKSLIINFEGLVNSRLLTPVFMGNSLFNTSVLAECPDAFKLVTNKFIRETSFNFLRNQSLLKCVRSYRIIKGEKLFRWHADNKSPIDGKVDESKGLVFIIYLDDDDYGSFSIAEKSNNTSRSAIASKKDVQNWEKNNLIKNIIAERGDLLIFSQDLFHRHILQKGNKSFDAIWFQVVSKENSKTEKILIDPSYLTQDLELIKFLGENNQEKINYANPRTSYGDLPFLETIGLIIRLTLSLFFKIPKNLKKEIIIFLRYIIGPIKNK